MKMPSECQLRSLLSLPDENNPEYVFQLIGISCVMYVANMGAILRFYAR
jgi:hypothetical protein